MPQLQMSTLSDSHPYLMTMCECHHGRGVHHNGRGMCRGHHCRCSRFVKRTRQFVHVEMMKAALSVAIEVIEALPGRGRTIQVGLPDENEKFMLLKQMNAAIAGPKIETSKTERGSLSLVLLTCITFAIGAGALLASFLDYVGVK